MKLLNRRRKYLINYSFQIRYIVFIVSLVFISSLVYPLSIYDLFENLLSKLNHTSENISLIAKTRFDVILQIILIQFVFFIIVIAASIFQSHKIAGPIFRIKSVLDKIAQGEEISEVKFRKTDNFPELAESFNKAFFYLKNQYRNDFKYLEKVITYTQNISYVVPDDKKALINEIIQELTAIQNRYKER